MPMTVERMTAARARADRIRPARVPPRGSGEDAGSPFTVHGHRLSSLYRGTRKAHKPFIVLKILKRAPVNSVSPIEYLRNSEIREGRA